MKPGNKWMIVLAPIFLFVMMTELSSCKKSDPEPSAQDKVKAKLIANNWKMQSVAADGVDQTSVYAGLTIQFTATNYTTTNGRVVWPASGTWTFIGTDGTMIKRNDGIEIKVEVTESTLKLTLTWTKSTLAGGRVASIKGVNVFNFTK